MENHCAIGRLPALSRRSSAFPRKTSRHTVDGLTCVTDLSRAMPESRGRKPKKQNAAAAQVAKGKAAAAQTNTAACQFTKANGLQCKRIVQSGSKYCWQHAHGLRAKLRALPRKPWVVFVITLAGLIPLALIFAGSTLMGLLPGPTVSVTIEGLRATSGNPAGCVTYMVNINTATPSDAVIEALYLTVQFPKDIASYKFGAANAAVLARNPKRVWMGLFEVGKDANGECSVVQAALSPSPDLTATIAGPGMVQLRGIRILPRSVIMGLFALSVKDASFQPPPPIFTEGSYEYTRFGYTVTKPLAIQNTGVHDAK
jgi:hypothetical protein